MASRLIVEKVPIRVLQKYHHSWLNNFSDQETLVEAIGNRPGIFGPNPVAYLSIFARRSTIMLNDLDEALSNDKLLIRAPAFRGSLFLLNTQDYLIYFRCFYNFLSQRGMKRLEEYGLSKGHLMLFKKLLEESDLKRPITSAQLMEIIFPRKQDRPNMNIFYHITQKLCDLGLLVRASAKGWKGNEFSYIPMKLWIPDLPLRPDTPESARTETIRKYLRAYGPATIEDISWWTGLPTAQCQRSIGNLKREAVRFHIEGYKEDMLGLKETVEHIRNPLPTKSDIQFLPPWDPYTLGWRCRKRVADKEHLPYIYDNRGNPTSVIVDCGKIIGVWQFRDNENNLLEYHIFDKYQHRKNYVLREAQEWILAIGKLTGNQSSNIVEKKLLEPLSKRPDGDFLWPLGKTYSKENKKVAYTPMERRTSNTFRKTYLDNEYLVRPNGV